ncbi:hypothetical protein ZIOFF_067801 [Zingiber officinale]|uniref:GAG-pre-integrase domain-containing protein n=1 Tax=Zingiber officinale TaxID=94328 RepID=A0A8J5EUT5_ZINOF|nr:hypothetical protein ZIOFF_067801 [Zingiber officinale]
MDSGEAKKSESDPGSSGRFTKEIAPDGRKIRGSRSVEAPQNLRRSSRLASIAVRHMNAGGILGLVETPPKVKRSLRLQSIAVRHMNADGVFGSLETPQKLRRSSRLASKGLFCSLLAHEQRINRSNAPSTEQAFKSKQSSTVLRNYGDSSNEGSKYSKEKSNKWRKNEKKTNWKGKAPQKSSNVESCIICKKSNHETSDCYYKCKRCKIPNHSQRDFWFQNKEKKDAANFSKEEEHEILFYSQHGYAAKHQRYLDSGASNHMTGNKELFVELNPNISSSIILGDGTYRSAKGKGTIAVQTKEGNKNLITDVLYVPSLSYNLLSIGQLIQKDFSVHFDVGKCKIFDKKRNTVVANVEMKNKTFSITLPLNNDCAFKVEDADLSHLWHLRYGHLNQRGLHLLKEKNMVTDLPNIQITSNVCEGCVYGKMHKLPFPKLSWQAKAPLELVHSDICGPM